MNSVVVSAITSNSSARFSVLSNPTPLLAGLNNIQVSFKLLLKSNSRQQWHASGGMGGPALRAVPPGARVRMSGKALRDVQSAVGHGQQLLLRTPLDLSSFPYLLAVRTPSFGSSTCSPAHAGASDLCND